MTLQDLQKDGGKSSLQGDIDTIFDSQNTDFKIQKNTHLDKRNTTSQGQKNYIFNSDHAETRRGKPSINCR